MAFTPVCTGYARAIPITSAAASSPMDGCRSKNSASRYADVVDPMTIAAALEQLGDLDQVERRGDAPLPSRRHVHPQREALQGLDRNAPDRLLATQNLLGLVPGKCARIPIVGDQSHE